MSKIDCLTLIKLKGSPDPEQTASEYLRMYTVYFQFVEQMGKYLMVPIYEKTYRHLTILYRQRDERISRIQRDTNDIGQLKWYFITIGYDDRLITPSLMKNLGDKLASKEFFRDVIYVHEKHRRDGSGNIYIHHHTHFLVVCDLPKTRIIDRVYATVKKYVASKNFVDVKSYKDNVGTYEQKLRYIEGDKVQEKLECVQLDDIWRSQNGLFRKI